MTKSAAAAPRPARPPSAPVARFAASSPSTRLVLLLSAASLLGFTNAAPGECIKDTTDIFDAEANIIDATTTTLREYILCGNTTYDIGYYDPDTDRYEGGMAGLDILRPNIHILCGPDGKRENGCILRGGGEQVFIANADNNSPPLRNVLISGVTFRNVENMVVGASARTDPRDEDGVLFKDCVFEDNYNVTAVVDAFTGNGEGVPPGSMTLTFDACTFRNNDVGILGEAMSALVYNVDHTMRIRNCLFENNQISAMEEDDTTTFVVANVRHKGSTGGKLDVTGSTFVNNTVSVGLVHDELSETTVGNNIAETNQFFATAASDESCEGLATYVSGTRGFDFDCLPFSVSWEPTSSPVVGGAPTMAPAAGEGLLGGAAPVAPDEEGKEDTVGEGLGTDEMAESRSAAPRGTAQAGRLATVLMTTTTLGVAMILVGGY